MKRVLLFVIGGTMVLPIIGFAISVFCRDLAWSQNVEGRLKRAADAGTIRLALQELKAVTAYLEANQLTRGQTGIIYNTPSTDIAFWYDNLKEAEKSLEGMSHFPLLNVEENAALLKLRQILLDHGEKGEYVTQPCGIYLYPYIGLYTFWGITGLVLVILGILLMFIAFILED